MTVSRIGMWPLLPFELYTRRPSKRLPFPLEKCLQVLANAAL